MRSIKLTVAYDGTAYAGWQVQRGQATVQGALEQALEQITGEHAMVKGSSRTDAGVHALGQVARVATSSPLSVGVLRRALNATLPADIAVLDVAEVGDGFDPVGDVLRKRYRYQLYDGPVRDIFGRRYCWWRPQRLDHDAMRCAATVLVGKHDFAAFENRGSQRLSTVRTVLDLAVTRSSGNAFGSIASPSEPPAFVAGCGRAEQGRAGQGRPGQGRAGQEDWLFIEVEADGFLYNMVRNIVGSLVEVGRGARPEGWIGQVLEACDRRLAGPTAPPQGLFLLWIDYAGRTEEIV